MHIRVPSALGRYKDRMVGLAHGEAVGMVKLVLYCTPQARRLVPQLVLEMDNEWKTGVGDRAGLGVMWAAGLSQAQKGVVVR